MALKQWFKASVAWSKANTVTQQCVGGDVHEILTWSWSVGLLGNICIVINTNLAGNTQMVLKLY